MLVLALLAFGFAPGQVEVKAPDPASCIAADQAKDVARAHPKRISDQRQLQDAARVCLSDLTAASRWDEAAARAAGFGLFEDAMRIARISTSMHMAPVPAPKSDPTAQ